MAPTIFSSNTGVLEKTIKKMKNCVLKTLMNYGGFGIYHIFLKGEEYYMEACNAKKRRINLRKFLKVATNNGKEKVAVVKYLKRVTNGDKRILVLDGCIISAILRRPRNKNGWICNISSGGTVSKTAVTPAEIKIIKLVSQKLRRHNVYFAGIDTLEDDNGKRVLSEINVTNVGAVYNTEKLYNKNISKHIIDWIVERAIKFHNS
jgi:glutathione synthase